LSQKELQRIKVVANAVAGTLTVVEAAELLQLSERQVKRLKQRHEPAGEWVHHGKRWPGAGECGGGGNTAKG